MTRHFHVLTSIILVKWCRFSMRHWRILKFLSAAHSWRTKLICVRDFIFFVYVSLWWSKNELFLGLIFHLWIRAFMMSPLYLFFLVGGNLSAHFLSLEFVVFLFCLFLHKRSSWLIFLVGNRRMKIWGFTWPEMVIVRFAPSWRGLSICAEWTCHIFMFLSYFSCSLF